MLLIIVRYYLMYSIIRLLYYICVGFLYKKKPQKNNGYDPLVSVIVPAWNEGVGIQKTISSIMRNGYKNIELICVNDGSTDNTKQRIDSLRTRYLKNKHKIIILNQVNSGKAKALNNGIHIASGEIIITIDADSYIYPGAIRKLVNTLSNKENDVAIGKIIVGNKRTLLGLAQYFEYMFGFHYKQTQDVLNSIYIFPGALCAVRKSVIEGVGYFDEHTSTEDLDLSMKIRHNGHKVAYVDDVRCITEGASDIKGLFSQRTRWRHGYLQCLLLRKDFVFKIKKGFYLSFVELPLSILGLLEILIFPFLFFYLWTQVIISQSPIVSIVSYLLLPFVFLMLVSNDEKIKLRVKLAVLLIPILFSLINFIEIIALVKSIYLLLFGKKSAWTIWQRKGAI